ncbi:galactokinase [Roseisolibacter sp. H3M3-2]|uniref:galactokinase n=1 Tax=Roseisolibacter sp. H3M3-2 TaxID=3031323 RepID=UPI0023DC5FFB|nr:galactokinase [Roseisolibacter sp. H3M3-2]MDF1504615.1 galactokinase [Roseisolibacter sp. H3M3-2]
MTSDDTPRARAVRAFAERFGAPPDFVARAPGRVNLIGEHTDYNDGFVFPVAIDRAVWIAGRARDDRRVVLHSLDFGDAAEVDLAAPEHRRKHWAEYVAGMAWALAEGGVPTPRGVEGVMAGNVPVGAGLSSSAALELAVARALSWASDRGASWEPARVARIAQRAENAWVGVNSGIMDQMISAAGRAGHALLIDCRSLETRAVPMGREAVVVLDTGTRRGLVDSAYNERRAQCEAAARHFGVRALRDVDLATFERRAGELDDVTRRRARHVITENARTLAAADALAAGDAATAGLLMDESHASLRDDFEVSRRELDVIVEIARAQEGCLGARMTGAGFGGCAVALVAPESAESLASEVASRYEREVGIRPSVYVCTPSEGASVENYQENG